MQEMTLTQVAARLQIGKSTLYGVLGELEDENPEIMFYFKIGNQRRFTENHYARIVGALECRSNLSRLESERETSTISSEGPLMVGSMNSARGRKAVGSRVKQWRKSKTKSSKVTSLQAEKIRRSEKRQTST